MKNYLQALSSKISQISVESWVFNTIFVFLLAGIYNIRLWQYMLHIYPLQTNGSAFFLLLAFIVLAGLYYILMTFFSLLRIEKTVAIFVVLGNAVVLYFMSHFAVVIDSTMIENVLQTDLAETKEIIGISILLYIIFAGLIPAWLIYKIKIRRPKTIRKKLKLFSTIIVPLALIGLIAATQFQDFATFIRNHKEARYHILPNNYVNALYKTAKIHLASAEKKSIPLVKASKDQAWKTHPKKTLFVFVVGETARAQNFSYNGYDRETTPLLKQKDILNFTNMHSCGTATAVSLPCMFSSIGRKNYDASEHENPNNLIQIVNRAGFKTAWIDNNSGCKGLCRGLPTFETADLLKYEHNKLLGETHDMVMLNAFDETLKSSTEDTFIVLHQKGSHGPGYYLRTPESFHQFKPICTTEELTQCSQEEIRNSYDNTLLYTDYFLSNVVDKLQSLSQDYNTAMIYVSDHGESLGENNLYLHGLPYMIAPDQQKHVPFMMWLSDGFVQQQHISVDCLKNERDNPFSQDNLFHSMLDVLDIKSTLKRNELSVFAACRAKQ